MTHNNLKDELLAAMKEAHTKFSGSEGGKNADYIPFLANVPSDLFGIAACLPDGDVLAVGDTDYRFGIESVSKVPTAILAMEQYSAGEVLDRMEIPVVIMEPLRGGRLADMPVTLADMLLAKDPEGSLASWAFRFAGSFPRVLTVLSGMTYMEHLEDNLRTYLDFKPLSDEEMELLQDVATRMETYPLVRCTGCNYCMPCPYGIDIPGIFKFYNDNLNAGTYVKSSEQEAYARTRRRYLLAYDKAIPTVRQADHCIQCGRCEEACPQHLGIRQELGKIDEYIESLKQETL